MTVSQFVVIEYQSLSIVNSAVYVFVKKYRVTVLNEIRRQHGFSH